MPANDGVWLHNDECFRQAGPKSSQQDPEQPIRCTQTRSGSFPLEHPDLLAKREHLEGDVGAAAKEDTNGGEKSEKARSHGSTFVTRGNAAETHPALCAQSVEFAAGRFLDTHTRRAIPSAIRIPPPTREPSKPPRSLASGSTWKAWKRGWGRAEKKVVMGDGAEWIWNLAEQYFPSAIQIVDLYHARQHPWNVARCLYPNAAGQKAWMTVHQKRLLDKGKMENLIAALHAARSSNSEVAEKIRTEADYFRGNAERMRYPKFRKQHLFVDSGVIEAGCKTGIGSRLKQSGMFWTLRGANAILALRCCHLNGGLRITGRPAGPPSAGRRGRGPTRSVLQDRSRHRL